MEKDEKIGRVCGGFRTAGETLQPHRTGLMFMATTADDWSIYWRVPVAYGYDPVTDDYYQINVDADGKVRPYDAIPKYWRWTASDDLLKSDDTEEGESGTAYVKWKTITFDPAPAEAVKTSGFRIKFDLRTTSDAHLAYGRVYKNGVAVGTEQSTNSETYVTKSEDIGNWEADDTIELWIKIAQAGITAIIKNFRIYGEMAAIEYTEPTWS